MVRTTSVLFFIVVSLSVATSSLAYSAPDGHASDECAVNPLLCSIVKLTERFSSTTTAIDSSPDSIEPHSHHLHPHSVVPPVRKIIDSEQGLTLREPVYALHLPLSIHRSFFYQEPHQTRSPIAQEEEQEAQETETQAEEAPPQQARQEQACYKTAQAQTQETPKTPA
jgi:hypothetical protein